MAGKKETMLFKLSGLAFFRDIKLSWCGDVLRPQAFELLSVSYTPPPPPPQKKKKGDAWAVSLCFPDTPHLLQNVLPTPQSLSSSPIPSCAERHHLVRCLLINIWPEKPCNREEVEASTPEAAWVKATIGGIACTSYAAMGCLCTT